jgi:hypothetical protein
LWANLEQSFDGEVEWLANDGVWRPVATNPPAFPTEVVETRAADDDAKEVERLAGRARAFQDEVR